MSNFSFRKSLFNKLSEHRGRKVITLITSHKKPEPLFATQIAQDALPIFYEILKKQKSGVGIDLLIHSSGGQIDTPWPLINLIREYNSDICVLVPWRAHSAATLIALGANSIEMGPLASLSPIDPQFQITSPQIGGLVAGVEDIYGFYDLIKETLKLDSQGKAEALKILAGRIGPEILGKISRTRTEIRYIATNLLKLNLTDESQIKKIVNKLVFELPSHQYFLNRREAKEMGLPINYMDKKTEEITFDILKSYREESAMDEPGLSVELNADELVKSITLSRAFIESRYSSYAFRSDYIVKRDGGIERKGDKWSRMV